MTEAELERLREKRDTTAREYEEQSVEVERLRKIIEGERIITAGVAAERDRLFEAVNEMRLRLRHVEDWKREA